MQTTVGVATGIRWSNEKTRSTISGDLKGQ